MLRHAPLAALLLLALVPSTHAGTSDDPEMVDPKGDVSAHGIPLPAGLEWADLAALWFDAADPTTVTMNIQVAQAAQAPAIGEVAALLAINGSHFLAGWSTVLPPMVVPYYQGGFYCPANPEGSVDPAQCIGIDAQIANDVFAVPLPAATLGIQPGIPVEIVTVYAEVWYLDVVILLDEAVAQRAFVMPGSEPEATDAEPVEENDAAGTQTDAAVQGPPEAADPRPLPEPRQAPGIGLAGLVAAFALVAAALKRRAA